MTARDLGKLIEPRLYERNIQVGDLSRRYMIHAPETTSDPAPVVIVFHGGGTNAHWLRRLCGLSEKADREGFLALYPSGTGLRPRRLSWNCGPHSGFERWVGEDDRELVAKNRVDEIAFIDAMIEDLASVASIDRRRVYATGISTGAVMSYYLAAHMADRIAAIAPVGGPMGEETCAPARPVPIIHFHGTEDEFAPYHGGKGERSFTGVDFFSVDHTIKQWARANRCTQPPRVERLPQKKDPTQIDHAIYSPDPGGAEIQLFTVHGGGHTWPGQDPRVDLMGRHVLDIDANDLIWEFFLRHELP